MANQTPRSDRPLRANATGTPSIIGSDVRIVGNVSTLGELQVDGEIEGDLQCGSLTMGEQGSVNGSVEAESAIVKGRIDGRIRAKKIRLEKTALVNGDLYHESLSVEAGARLSGQVVHASQEDKAQQHPSRLPAPEAKAPEGDNAKPVKAVG
ncbi:MAG: polymer-forming cytoskeletal protein [Rhodothalassiaceae bacterium]